MVKLKSISGYEWRHNNRLRDKFCQFGNGNGIDYYFIATMPVTTIELLFGIMHTLRMKIYR